MDMAEQKWAIEIDGLTKHYGGGRLAVDNLTIRVPATGVHGFLGPNGSGKSTTIRLLLGLVQPTQGLMKIFGTPVPERLPEVIAHVGAIVERPRFFPEFSGHKNLRLLARSISVPVRVVDEVIELVGLGDRARDRYATYSLGMQQRLAVAATLLKNPRLVILDEPTNGLDPAGIREMRDMIRTLADRGKAVLVSSHLISELEQVVDSVTIIRGGRCLAEGMIDDVLGRRVALRVGVADTERAGAVLRKHGWAVTVRPRDLDVTGDWPAETVTRQLAEAGLWVREIHSHRASLEQRFLELTALPDHPHPLRRIA